MTDFELNGQLGVDDVTSVRRLVEKLQRRFSVDHAERVAMAAHELLENAIKFSADGAASIRIDLTDSNVTIKTRNRARPENLDSLKSISSRLDGVDPLEFYVSCMKASPKSPGGLGIGRVAYEAEMQIGMTFDNDMVEVRAVAALA